MQTPGSRVSGQRLAERVTEARVGGAREPPQCWASCPPPGGSHLSSCACRAAAAPITLCEGPTRPVKDPLPGVLL